MLDDGLEGVIAVAIIEDFLGGKRNIRHMGPGGLLVQHHQLPAILVGKRPQKHPVHETENGGIDTNPERQDDQAG